MPACASGQIKPRSIAIGQPLASNSIVLCQSILFVSHSFVCSQYAVCRAIPRISSDSSRHRFSSVRTRPASALRQPQNTPATSVSTCLLAIAYFVAANAMIAPSSKPATAPRTYVELTRMLFSSPSMDDCRDALDNTREILDFGRREIEAALRLDRA